jgi:8-oxo-dGTP diphosphatase
MGAVPSPEVLVMGAAIIRRGRVLAARRTTPQSARGLWEFPGGKVEPGEADEAALAREIRERLDAEVKVGQLISFVRHPYERYTVDLHLYQAELLSGVRICQVQDYRWIRSDQFDEYEFTPADEASMNKLLGESSEP